MDESRNARQPKKPDNNELWSWIVIALLFAFAWPVGLIVLFAKLSDSNKRKKNRAGAQQTIITAEPEDAVTATAAPTAAEKKKSDSAAQSRKRKSSITRTPKISDSNANVLRNIGLVVTVIGAIILFNALGDNLFFLEYGNWRAFLEYTFWPMGITAGGLGLLLGSHWMRRRLRRYAKYQAIAGKKPTVTISQLAAAANVSTRRVENDLEQMVQKGFWGKEAYLDLGRGVLVRTFEAAEGLEQAQKETQPAPAEAEEGYSGQLRDIRRANDRIADPAISAKIDRLEDLAGKIFRIVEEEPAKKAKASTFLNYYLPTTQKLLDSYADFEEAGVSGGNVSQAKQRIADTMDKIVAGFERQLDQLYQSDAMDVDSDIRVMEQMLRRDGGSVSEDFGMGAALQQEQSE
ncbi:MAG: 5-bromo-4-chloroindolyl phosphate hydrolysis family protein [Firmicutes bacterium]|nr:5-bromo-4-chloroindolyl phosphate hydrolysis family protein [Bacillota bacterium]